MGWCTLQIPATNTGSDEISSHYFWHSIPYKPIMCQKPMCLTHSQKTSCESSDAMTYKLNIPMKPWRCGTFDILNMLPHMWHDNQTLDNNNGEIDPTPQGLTLIPYQRSMDLTYSQKMSCERRDAHDLVVRNKPPTQQPGGTSGSDTKKKDKCA